MGRYLLKFAKEDRLKYISHLDLLRLFQRGFKRAGIKLRYSQGYNPHAKIGFALPLSLGFESGAEYMEFETENEYNPDEAAENLRNQMPGGLGIISCTALAETSKTPVAAVLDYAAYRVEYKGTAEVMDMIPEAMQNFLKQDSIINVKYSKKKRRNIESDIRGFIHSVTPVKKDGVLIFSMMLRTGSHGNLNPEILVEEFCRFAGIDYIRTQWSFRRTEMFYLKGKDMIPLSEFNGQA